MVSEIYKARRKVGRPAKDPARGPQRPVRIPLGYDKNSPQGKAELARRIKMGQMKAKLRRQADYSQTRASS
ncbi:MAG: hypothetical protein FJ320_08490 [SAR202 cluster bacterium]|nr:hypothetical protein [SAR202 cluster bacterium]